MNNVMNLNNMDDSELEVLQQKISDMRLNKLLEKVEGLSSAMAYNQTQNNLKFNEMDDNYNEVKSGVKDIKDQLFILATMPAKLKELKDSISRKVVTLTNGYGTNEYVLFSRMLFGRLGKHLKDSFQVTRYDSIKVDDLPAALTIVNLWTPKSKDYRDILNDYINNEDDISHKKVKALHAYLNKKGGSI